jgi:hypothetical protein
LPVDIRHDEPRPTPRHDQRRRLYEEVFRAGRERLHTLGRSAPNGAVEKMKSAI